MRKRKQTVATRVTSERYEEIEQYCEENELSQADALREFIDQGLEREEKNEIRNGINTILNKLENDTDDDVDTREVVSSQILASPKTSSALDIIQLILLAVLTALVIFTTGAGL